MKIKLMQKLSTTQIIAIGFLLVIIIGSFLLTLPISHTGELSYMEALFTATSATCITGHLLVDIESSFTTFGKVIVLLLMQIGGLRLYACCGFNINVDG